ncbi:MAG: MraY family glycosyltransferase [Woeseiaceae bacterium]|jgi:UDP-GlcNAc:undecaprenyl-phosphate GlcNAc-1-phosphate transferase|nr:MraY family glycosyltransferase [Woeseiaceae bacterium]
MSEALYLASMAVALAVTISFVFALRPVAKSVDLVDHPGGRKTHVGIVPIVGGIAMFIGLFAGLSLVADVIPDMESLFVASLLLVAIGVVDDKYHVPPAVRMMIQLAAIVVMVYGGELALRSLGNPVGLGDINMGPLSFVMTLMVTLTVVNAFNLVDGVDGLAGSLALISLLSISTVGGTGSPFTIIGVTGAAAIFGFLIFNFPTPWNRLVRTFMGDAGSTFLGFIIVWVTLGLSQGSGAVVSPVYCLWFAALPIFDLFTCVVRRIAAGKSPFKPGRDHFHHTLKRGGMGVRAVLGTLTLLQLVYASIGLLGFYAGVSEPLMFVAWVILAASQRTLIVTIRRQHRFWVVRKRRRSNSSFV